jgi:hypothetical protein
MQGFVTKKHFFAIWAAFGAKKAFKILLSRKPVALNVLMED